MNIVPIRLVAPTLGLVIVSALGSGCGDDSKPNARTTSSASSSPSGSTAASSETAAPPPAVGEGPVPSSHTPVTATEHETFEKLYTEQCIKSQQDNPDTAIRGDQELGRVCECMAKQISKRISKADAVQFNEQHEFPFDLVMMTNAAAAQCTSSQ